MPARDKWTTPRKGLRSWVGVPSSSASCLRPDIPHCSLALHRRPNLAPGGTGLAEKAQRVCCGVFCGLFGNNFLRLWVGLGQLTFLMCDAWMFGYEHQGCIWWEIPLVSLRLPGMFLLSLLPPLSEKPLTPLKHSPAPRPARLQPFSPKTHAMPSGCGGGESPSTVCGWRREGLQGQSPE